MKNVKHLTLCASLCVLTMGSVANTSSYYKTGAVLGTGLGYSHLSSKTTDTLFFDGVPQSSGTFKKTPTSNGFVADLIAGYRFAFNKCFVAGVNVVLTKDTNRLKSIIDIPNAGATSTTKLYRQFSVTPEIMGGYVFAQQWMAYLKLGLSISRFKLDNKVIGESTVSTNKIVTKVGFKPTLGVEYAMNSKASVFTDVSYEYIPSIKKSLENPSDPNTLALTDTHDVKVRPHYFTAKIGVMYKF